MTICDLPFTIYEHYRAGVTRKSYIDLANLHRIRWNEKACRQPALVSVACWAHGLM
jgi:hypothetical protein